MLEQRVARSAPQGKAVVLDICKSFRLLFSATGSGALLGFLPFPWIVVLCKASAKRPFSCANCVNLHILANRSHWRSQLGWFCDGPARWQLSGPGGKGPSVWCWAPQQLVGTGGAHPGETWGPWTQGCLQGLQVMSVRGCVQPQWAGSSQEQPRFEFLFPYMPLSRKLALQENISSTSKVLEMA